LIGWDQLTGGNLNKIVLPVTVLLGFHGTHKRPAQAPFLKKTYINQ
jgi:hypothetical protein